MISFWTGFLVTHSDNREGEDFECLKCGYENHADYNAAKNIGLRYLRRNQTGGDEGAPVGVRLNRGMFILNVDGRDAPSNQPLITALEEHSAGTVSLADSRR